MKVKKIIKKVIAASMSLALVHTTIAPIPVFAAESNKQFSEETVITTENVYDVLSYLDIDENNLEVNQEASYATVTVGELKEAIDSAKKYQKEVEKDSTINIEDISSSPQSTRATYSKTLSSDLVVGSATITFNAVGYYSGKHWTNASASNASVDSDFVIYTYKLSGQSNKTTCTSSCIFHLNVCHIRMYITFRNFIHYDLIVPDRHFFKDFCLFCSGLPDAVPFHRTVFFQERLALRCLQVSFYISKRNFFISVFFKDSDMNFRQIGRASCRERV